MCTLIVGCNVAGPGTVVLAANRDENPGRPTDPPTVLSETPRVVGGRDRLAGGTWLAIREARAVVALLNRHDPDAPRDGAKASGLRSRGLLALDVALAAHDTGPERARALAQSARYAPFSLLFASAQGCWMLAQDQRGLRTLPVSDAWHVLTHRELDDPAEPRAAYLMRRLRDYRPASVREAEEHLARMLREHGGPSAPPVCLHTGPMVTVSSSVVSLGRDGPRYLHAEGRPCRHEYADHSGLLLGVPGEERR
jgi:uncharacterized protein with NRDE domain